MLKIIRNASWAFTAVVGTAAMLHAEEVRPEPLTRAEAEARAADDIDYWRDAIAEGRPRLYYTPDQWAELPFRYEESEGRERELFETTLEFARTLLDKPAPAYKPPEAYVGKKRALRSAQAELWQRPIGDNMVVLSLAYHLTGEEAFAERLRDYVLTACSYPAWGLRSRKMHLAASHMARGVAVAYDWLPELWSEDEKALIRKTIEYHVSDIEHGLYGNVFWATALSNNHNHVSVAALGMCGVAFLDEIPDAAVWAGGALLDMERVVEYNNSDGSTPEGASYWNYSLNSITQFTAATHHVLDVEGLFESDFLRNAINYRLYSSAPDYIAVLPWGATSTQSNSGAILYALASHYDDSTGQFLADHMELSMPRHYSHRDHRLQSRRPQRAAESARLPSGRYRCGHLAQWLGRRRLRL
ncbi:DUF4962 domain-containing protein [Ruficoccus sp. ZRK36]|uniref:DUF4962 domain-containing protein n=1 Tax=Ruficoccus sp. ZRK36 TaxID=2866311 RepID=UPI001C73B3B8|nr:DUF4962 domain-containing protein [Ruficoccus sp. ZRK36]QYY35211.1 DUF4962 domain-containing protein [Ruficoccus sp. ZRK36]